MIEMRSPRPARGLATRDERAREHMDDPDCDARALERTYRRFALVNRVVAGQRAVYRRWVRPRLSRDARRVARLLDVGTGGADFPRRLLAWARRDGLRLEVLAIDPDPRSIAFVTGLGDVAGLRARAATTSDLAREGARFDIVLSNHLLHHLTPGELGALLADSERLLAPGGVAVHGDIERSTWGYVAFAAATAPLEPWLLRDTFIRPDGLTSIRRSHTARELELAVPGGWRVRRAWPSRLELIREAP